MQKFHSVLFRNSSSTPTVPGPRRGCGCGPHPQTHCPLGHWAWKPLEQLLGMESRGPGFGGIRTEAADRPPASGEDGGSRHAWGRHSSARGGHWHSTICDGEMQGEGRPLADDLQEGRSQCVLMFDAKCDSGLPLVLGAVRKILDARLGVDMRGGPGRVRWEIPTLCLCHH